MSKADEQHKADWPRRSRLPLWTGLVGFVLGAVFWHLVGFWSFVAEVAYNQDETKSPARLINLEEARAVSASSAERRNEPAREPANERATVRAASADPLADLLNCTEVRRVASGGIAVSACPPLARRLADAGSLASRADRQMDAREAEQRLLNGWSTGVSRIETGSLD